MNATSLCQRAWSTLFSVVALSAALSTSAFASDAPTCGFSSCPLAVKATATASGVAATTESGTHRDYPILVGKRTVWASTIAPQVAASPAPVMLVNRADTHDYLVTVGKRTMWASQAEAATTVVPGSTAVVCSHLRTVLEGKRTYGVADCPLKETTKSLACCG